MKENEKKCILQFEKTYCLCSSLLACPLALHLKDEFVDLEGAPITFVNLSLFRHRQVINDGQVYPSNPKKEKT
jgi:hypothetical protein